MTAGAASVWVLDSVDLLDDTIGLALTAGLGLSVGAGLSRATASQMRLSPLTRPSTRSAMLHTWRVPARSYGLVWAGAGLAPSALVVGLFTVGVGGSYLIVGGPQPLLVLPAVAAAMLNHLLLPVAADLAVATSAGRRREGHPPACGRWTPLVALAVGAALAATDLALRSGGSTDLALPMVSLGHHALAALTVSLLLETCRSPRVDRLYRDRTSVPATRLRIAWSRSAAPESWVLLHHLRRSRGHLLAIKLALLTAIGVTVLLLASASGLDAATLASTDRGTVALAAVFATVSMIVGDSAMTVWPTRQLAARLRGWARPERVRRAPAVILGCYALLAVPLAVVLLVAALALRPGLWVAALLMPPAAVGAAVLLHCVSRPAIQPGGAEVLDVVAGTGLTALSYVPLASTALPGWVGGLLLACYVAALMGGASACLGRLLSVRPSSSAAWS
jgi:hypothetical protein